ncbi:hypothetical protein Plim_3732 [Planctopirus limnophila DSM 3776]|uniref:Uncharacterized protein n=1 Tax=Planctopirus limnophila (strain ATCC 43296 / DSM 3776 / IFAM 1008 / Mu 290) TaxID=521674 RepID=D5SWF1_PLAL2|nr:hypothetical protein Plim_3732 [Planctopirus limnophila DSM 3776]
MSHRDSSSKEEEVMISCETWKQIVESVNLAGTQLSITSRRKLGSIFRHYFALYDLEGAYENLNNKSVSQIFQEYENTIPGKPLASGQVDGVSYDLYEQGDDVENH